MIIHINNEKVKKSIIVSCGVDKRYYLLPTGNGFRVVIDEKGIFPDLAESANPGR